MWQRLAQILSSSYFMAVSLTKEWTQLLDPPVEPSRPLSIRQVLDSLVELTRTLTP